MSQSTLQDGITLNIDVEHRALERFLAGRSAAAAGKALVYDCQPGADDSETLAIAPDD